MLHIPSRIKECMGVPCTGNDLVRLSKTPPGGVYEGGDFVLYCEGAKYKTLWYHDAKPISSGKLYKIDGNFNSLLSATASSTSEGIYQCEVNNVRSNECSVRIRRGKLRVTTTYCKRDTNFDGGSL